MKRAKISNKNQGISSEPTANFDGLVYEYQNKAHPVRGISKFTQQMTYHFFVYVVSLFIT